MAQIDKRLTSIEDKLDKSNDKFDKFLEKADDRYASKTTEKIVY
jgi:hypothetical protein